MSCVWPFDVEAAPLLAAYPHFDARVMRPPDKEEAANTIGAVADVVEIHRLAISGEVRLVD
jgi:hypothetical protein